MKLPPKMITWYASYAGIQGVDFRNFKLLDHWKVLKSLHPLLLRKRNLGDPKENFSPDFLLGHNIQDRQKKC